jgi:hypothetical protein
MECKEAHAFGVCKYCARCLSHPICVIEEMGEANLEIPKEINDIPEQSLTLLSVTALESAIVTVHRYRPSKRHACGITGETL